MVMVTIYSSFMVLPDMNAFEYHCPPTLEMVLINILTPQLGYLGPLGRSHKAQYFEFT